MKKFLVVILLSCASVVWAKNIAVVIPFAAGGPTDQLWRSIEPKLNERLKSHNIRLVTDNLPGAGGTIAANKIAATDDRLILGFFSPALAIAPAMNADIVKYDVSMLRMIGYAGATEMIVVSTLTQEQFNERCKSERILFGSSNIGSTSHLLGTVVGRELSCKNRVHIPYKGQSQVYVDLIAGRIDYLVDFAISAEGHIASGNVNRLFSMNERFPNNLENWHVLISNRYDDPDIKIIEQEFAQLKRDQQFVDQLERTARIKNFKSVRGQDWLAKEFKVYKKFAESVK
jgi:tripartite-type tricarboxylate transporter receptor subunit TctC